MQRLTGVVRLIIVAAVLGSCVSCTSVRIGKMTMEVGAPRDISKLKEIQAGVTGLREILEWFGPPDCIIDGTQEIFDQQEGMTAGFRLPTRTLSAPKGEVILLYTLSLRMDAKSVYVAHPVVEVDKTQYNVRANELMIFIRKRDHKVLNAFTGGETNEHS